MLDYELCKQLKDSGFPQPILIRICEHHRFVHGFEDGEISSYSPGLFELIEACGDGFDSLIKRGDVWEAWGNYTCCEEHGDGKKIEEGSTPEEALARLWLALNEKK